MPNRPARFTTADLRRALKAAEQSGPTWAVEIDPDGTIRLLRRPADPHQPDVRKEIVLW